MQTSFDFCNLYTMSSVHHWPCKHCHCH